MNISRTFVTLIASAAMALLVGACDTSTDPSDPNAPQTDSKCDFSFADSNQGKLLGEQCTTNAECRFGACVTGSNAGLPAVSSTFGYCSRGCDCGTTATQLTDDEKLSFSCVYPPGNQGRWRHVVPKCDSFADCSVNPGFKLCGYPGTGARDLCLEVPN